MDVDWCEEAVRSEVAYSVARGGVPSEHASFIHVLNTAVPWSRDYNRAIGVRASNVAELEHVTYSVARIHEESGRSPLTALRSDPLHQTHGTVLLEERIRGVLPRRHGAHGEWERGFCGSLTSECSRRAGLSRRLHLALTRQTHEPRQA